MRRIDGKDFYIHKIEKGQSLYAISKLYDVKLEDIYANNPETKEGTKAGQEIKIPSKRSETVASGTVSTAQNPLKTNPEPTVVTIPVTIVDTNEYKVHVVARKETLYSICKKYNITEAEVKILNPSLLTQGLKTGQYLVVGEKKRKIVKTQPTSTVIITHPDSANPNVIHRSGKEHYKVALILPFRFEESSALDIPLMTKNKTPFPLVPAYALDFYLGFKSACDSISVPGFSISTVIHDIDAKDSARLAKLVNEPAFKDNDMIIGPLHANGFRSIAQKAKELGVPVISPVTQQNKILFNNVYVSKTNPSQFTLMESLADYLIDSLVVNNANIILAAPAVKDPKEDVFVKAFRKYYNEKQRSLGKQAKDTVTYVKGLEGVKKAYRADAKNIVVILTSNQVFISDFTTQLAIFAEKKDITLCGWQSISTLENIDQEYLNQLHYTFPSQYNLTNTQSYMPVITRYREQLNAWPGDYFFIGYDVATYYLKNLKAQGPDFIYKLNQLPAETGYMRFKYVRPDNQTGFDNRGVYIFAYKDYQLYRTGWK